MDYDRLTHFGDNPVSDMRKNHSEHAKKNPHKESYSDANHGGVIFAQQPPEGVLKLAVHKARDQIANKESAPGAVSGMIGYTSMPLGNGKKFDGYEMSVHSSLKGGGPDPVLPAELQNTVNDLSSTHRYSKNCAEIANLSNQEYARDGTKPKEEKQAVHYAVGTKSGKGKPPCKGRHKDEYGCADVLGATKGRDIR